MALIDVLVENGVPRDVASAITLHSKAYAVPLDFALAVGQQESDFQMVYGHDYGGVYSTNPSGISTNSGTYYPANSNVPVTTGNFWSAGGFFDQVVTDRKLSNGVGIYQETYWTFIRDAKAVYGHDLATVDGNVAEGHRILRAHLDTATRAGLVGDDALRYAAVLYNQGSPSTPEPWRTQWYGSDVMSRVTRWRGILAAAEVPITPSPAPAPTPAPTPVPVPSPTTQITPRMKVTSTVNVRSGPGTEYSIVSKLYAGDIVSTTGATSAGWVQITLKRRKRWVSGSYLSPLF